VLVPIPEQLCRTFPVAHVRLDRVFHGAALWDQYAGGGIILCDHDYPYYFFDHAGSADGGATASAGAALALGATRWEMIRISVLRNARAGIMGGIILGLGRALGETMAVTMVIGNRPEIAKSLFAPGYHHGERAGQ